MASARAAISKSTVYGKQGKTALLQKQQTETSLSTLIFPRLHSRIIGPRI
jgi:hypothetical protein